MDYIIEGSVHKFGDNINTDLISPAQYMELNSAGIAAHAMEGADPDFPKKVKPGDIIVAGKNFGSGSSRETAPLAIKGAGVSLVVAQSFARIFYRNCINIGLPVLICPQAPQIQAGETLKVMLSEGLIYNTSNGENYYFDAMPEHLLQLLKNGGLIGNLEANLHCGEEE